MHSKIGFGRSTLSDLLWLGLYMCSGTSLYQDLPLMSTSHVSTNNGTGYCVNTGFLLSSSRTVVAMAFSKMKISL